MEKDLEGEVRVYSTEEIDLFLNGDRRDVDTLILHSVNNIAKVLIPHLRNEDRIFQEIGPIEMIRTRSAWIDAEIAKKEATTLFYSNLKQEVGKELGKKGAIGLILILATLIVFWWNGHVPDSMELPLPLGK